MSQTDDQRPDIVVILTDEERAAPSYESKELAAWRLRSLPGRNWFDDHGVRFDRHYTGSLACLPSRPTLFTGQFPDVHGVTQTDGIGKMADDSRMRWMRPGEVPTLGNWLRAAGYDTFYDGKWHMSDANLVDQRTGGTLATNDDDGHVDESAVSAYLAADPLDPFGFTGWVGPEPHGPSLANSGLIRDPITADRIVAWLEDRYARRRAREESALRPFLLVASFVNPHDIVLFPAWLRSNPLGPLSKADRPPTVAASPTDDEDLATKPAAQIAFRESYYSGYGPPGLIATMYKRNAQEYRDLYYRLHFECDDAIDRVRRAVTDGGSTEAVFVRSSDHGELLGSHGGLHQKWFNLYDEATRVPFVIARIGARATEARVITDMATSHVDLVPTLLAAAGIDESVMGERLSASFSEVHPLPGRNLLGVVDGEEPVDLDRTVYLMTRDNVLEGDSGASRLARLLGRTSPPPNPMRIRVPAHVAANFEAVVGRVRENEAAGGGDRLWKLVRTFDDPSTWTEPGHRHLAADGTGALAYRTEPLDDQWELYDLTSDPIETVNLAAVEVAGAVIAHLQERLKTQRHQSVPERHEPWPYVRRVASGGPAMVKPPPVARLIRGLLQRAGLHPSDVDDSRSLDLLGHRALIVCTNHGVLDIGKPTGVFSSEMTAPYYVFADAGMTVDIGSPAGGVVPIDPQSLRAPIRCEFDDRFLADDDLRAKVTNSAAIADLDMDTYDIVYLAGGWGAAFDFEQSESLAEQITRANALGKVIGGVCHGLLGLCNARDADGAPLVAGRHISAVTDKQVRELGIASTPRHPETELRRRGALYESKTRFRDPLANHWVVDGNLVTGQNQNAAPMVARIMAQLVAG